MTARPGPEAPTAAVLEAFGLGSAAVLPLPGGQRESFGAAHLVFKPAADLDETVGVADLLEHLPERGFRLGRPVRALDGRWIVDGWAATRFVDGNDDAAGRWAELLGAGRAFAAALAGRPRPAFLAGRRHRWAFADAVAWGEADVEVLAPVAPLYTRLLALRRPVDAPAQVVHGDLHGNVLFADGLAPAIIDVSPYWRPAEYADAVVAVDGVIWNGAGPELLDLAATTPLFPQLLVRALLFRLVAQDRGGRRRPRQTAGSPGVHPARRPGGGAPQHVMGSTCSPGREPQGVRPRGRSPPVLTWFAVASFVAAAGVALRWWARRRDGVGRVRPFPVVSVIALAVAGAAAAVPVVRHARLEGELSAVATRLVGAPVTVHCQTVGEDLVATDQDLGFVSWGPDGRPERRTVIKREPCNALAGYLGSDHARPSEDEVRAVHVLSHESQHMAGETDEARTECRAMQRDAFAARLLGADPAQALRLARSYWLVEYPRMPDGYRNSACAPDGGWDEHLPDAPWGTD